MNLANSCLPDISPLQFWTISEQYPDLIKHLKQQVGLKWGQFGLNGGVRWLQILMVLSVSSANQKLKTSIILQSIAQTSERNSSPSGQI